MNGWGLLGLALFSLATGASVTLWPYRSMKAENERLRKEIGDYVGRTGRLAREGANLRAECDAWEFRAHEVETERNELREQVDALRLQLDEALRPKSPPPSDGTKKPRVNRIKPTSLEPPSMA